MSPSEFTDKELVEAALQNREIYRTLVERYGLVIEATIRYEFPELVKLDLVGDIAQEAFFRAWKNLSELEEPQQFYPWVRKIARNIALMYCNREKKQHEAEAAKIQQKNIVVPERDDVAVLLEGVEKLPKELREIIELKYIQCMTFAQIGNKLGIAKSTAQMRLTKAIRIITRDFEPSKMKVHDPAESDYILRKLGSSFTVQPQELVDDRLKHAHRKPIPPPQVSADDILNWWPDVPSPPPRRSMPVTLRVKDCGRAQTSPIEDPWA